MNWDWKKWAVAALIRAVRTFAQTFASMIAVGAAFSEIDWLRALSVSGVAFVLIARISAASAHFFQFLIHVSSLISNSSLSRRACCRLCRCLRLRGRCRRVRR